MLLGRFEIIEMVILWLISVYNFLSDFKFEFIYCCIVVVYLVYIRLLHVKLIT